MLFLLEGCFYPQGDKTETIGTMQAVLHYLESFIQKLQGDLEVAMSNGFICRPCVRLMERYQYLCEEIAGNVAKAIPFLPVGRGMFV